MTRASSSSCSRSFSIERKSKGSSAVSMNPSGGESRTARGAAWRNSSRPKRSEGENARGLLPIVLGRRQTACAPPGTREEWSYARFCPRTCSGPDSFRSLRVLFEENAHHRRGHRLNTSHQPDRRAHGPSPDCPGGAWKSGFEQQVHVAGRIGFVRV